MNTLDSRTWLLWGISCMVPLLISRHPVLIAQMVVMVIAVRVVCLPPTALRWGWIVRVAAVFAVIGIVFNALTVRSGNQIAFEIPGLEWTVTWNAIAYGAVSGLAMLALVLVGVTTAAGLDWIALTRVLPRRLAPLAVSGSVAWSFLPAASQSFAEIREAQAARGHQIRSGRDVLPIMVPLLDGALGRALAMSETLEARGFGASAAATATPTRSWLPLFSALVVVGGVLAAYALGLGQAPLLWPALAVAALGVVGLVRTPSMQTPTSRYREYALTRADVIVMIASVGALVAFLALAAGDPAAIVFNPYPDLELPALDYRLLLALSPLLTPALFPYFQEQP